MLNCWLKRLCLQRGPHKAIMLYGEEEEHRNGVSFTACGEAKDMEVVTTRWELR